MSRIALCASSPFLAALSRVAAKVRESQVGRAVLPAAHQWYEVIQRRRVDERRLGGEVYRQAADVAQTPVAFHDLGQTDFGNESTPYASAPIALVVPIAAGARTESGAHSARPLGMLNLAAAFGALRTTFRLSSAALGVAFSGAVAPAAVVRAILGSRPSFAGRASRSRTAPRAQRFHAPQFSICSFCAQ